MAKETFNEDDGVWRTVGGRRIFIRNGQSLADAMVKSGKFKSLRSTYRKEKEKEEQEKPKEENKYASAKHEGFGDYNKDNIPVYDGKIDYTGDFGRNADLSTLSDEELRTALNIQSEEYHKATNETLGDQRTRNGKMDKIFNTAKVQKYEQGMNLLNEEMQKRDLPRYNIYNENGMIMASSPTKEMADRQLKEMQETDKNLQKEYGWKELPKYDIKEGKVDEYLNERKEVKNEYTKEELKEKFGTDNVDLINAGRESDRRVSLKEENKDTFTSKSTNPFYPDAEYSKEELKRMDEAGVRPMKDTYSGNGWEGVNSDKHLSTSEQAKAITGTMKEKYPDVKIARKSDVYSGGSSIDFNIMSSEKDLYVSDADIDKMVDNRDFDRMTSTYEFERWAKDNVKDYETKGTYTLQDQKKYAKEILSNLKKRDNQNVRGDEWYLSDYGKKVVSELNKQANSYTYDDSDAMTDYFNHGTYMNISIGKWNKPYEVKGSNSNSNDWVRDAFNKYKEEHPGTKKTFAAFKKENEDKE